MLYRRLSLLRGCISQPVPQIEGNYTEKRMVCYRNNIYFLRKKIHIHIVIFLITMKNLQNLYFKID